MRIPIPTVKSIVLIAWAIFFARLWKTGDSFRYLGPKTQWVVPFGAVTLTLAAAAHAFYAALEPASRRRGITAREILGSIPLLLPLLAILAVPHAELGAQAASKKQASRDVLIAQIGGAAKARRQSDGEVNTSFLVIATSALQTVGGSGLQAGDRVQLSGLVTRGTTAKGTYGLTRFLISCCVADAIPVIVPVDPGGAAVPPNDTWLLVTGRMKRSGDHLVVLAEAMQRTVAPKSAYLDSWRS